jgi:putative ABC transport system permease protein
MNHFVQQHTHELGIRLALGGQPADVRRLVIALGVRVTGAGLLIGLFAAAGATRLFASQLFGITRTDQAGGLVWAAVLLLAFAAIACALPGRRASRLNPAALLRE